MDKKPKKLQNTVDFESEVDSSNLLSQNESEIASENSAKLQKVDLESSSDGPSGDYDDEMDQGS